MRARFTLGLLGLMPVAIWLAPRLAPVPRAPRVATLEPAAVAIATEAPPTTWDEVRWTETEPYSPEVDILGTYVWDGCTLRPSHVMRDMGRADLHVRTGYIADDRLPELYSRLDDSGVPGVHLGFYTAPRSLEALRSWKDLRHLTFEGDHLDDEAMAPLADLGNLRMLEIGVRPYEHNAVTDVGLHHLSHLRHLRYLGLHAFEGVSGEGLRHLVPLQELQDLELSYTRVDDASMRYLAHLDQLRTLSLQHTRVTDAGVAELRFLPALKTLDLRQTDVTPAIADVLATFPELERVVLHHNLQHDVIDAVRAVGLQADGIGWIRGTVGCEYWDRLPTE